MRMSAKEFATQPVLRPGQPVRRQPRRRAAAASTSIEATTDPDQRADIGILRVKVETLKGSFSSLINEQEQLGFTESDGLHERLSQRRHRASSA